MTIVLALACGAAIGLVLGALGGGGSILAVPALVYVLGQSAQDATTASLVIIGIGSAVSAVVYHLDRFVKWKVAVIFAAIGTLASFAGTALNRHVDDSVLLISFAAVTVISASLMLAKSRPGPKAARTETPHTETSGGREGATVVTTASPERFVRTTTGTMTAVQVVVAALLVGFLTGFLGVGGGFIVVPALVTILGFPMPAAAGTSLLIIAMNSATSLAIHAGAHPHFDWAVIAPFTIATIATAYAGRRVASRCTSTVLTRAFAGVLLLVGLGISLEVALPHLTS